MLRHPFAATLSLPAAELQEDTLSDSIRQHGVIHPVVLLDDKILDGWLRFKLATKHGKTFNTVAYTGGRDDRALTQYLLAVNIHRRHYTALQRAMLAARVLMERRGIVKGGPQEFSSADAAKMFGVSIPYIALCTRILSSKNTLLIHKVEAGKANREEVEDTLAPEPASNKPNPKPAGTTASVTALPPAPVRVEQVIAEFEHLSPKDQRKFVEALIAHLTMYIRQVDKKESAAKRVASR